MGHDAHFLERLDRISHDQTDLALTLYRDHEAVRHLLDRESVPKEASRIAISLAHPERGPFVVVARDGHFVTCLGEGMWPGQLPILRREVLFDSMYVAATQRQRRAIATELLGPDDDGGNLFSRMTYRKNMLSREEMSALASFAPLLVDPLFRASVAHVTTLIKGVHARKHFDRSLSDLHARAVWTCAYVTELCGTVDRRVMDSVLDMLEGARHGLPPDLRDPTKQSPSFSSMCAHLNDATFLLRGAWAAGRLGPRLLPVYEGRLATTRSRSRTLDAILGVAAIGLRHRDASEEAARILLSAAARETRSEEHFFASRLSQLAAATIAKFEESKENALLLGTDEYLKAIEGKLAPGDEGYAETPDQVPEDLAATAYFNVQHSFTDFYAGVAHVLTAIPLLGIVEVEHFHYPAAILKKIEKPWGEPEARAHFESLRGHAPRTETVTVTKVSRNDPCPCGSGKKAKRCCH